MVLRWMVCDTLLAYEVAVVEKYIHTSSLDVLLPGRSRVLRSDECV
jgi:hypothetical protein